MRARHTKPIRQFTFNQTAARFIGACVNRLEDHFIGVFVRSFGVGHDLSFERQMYTIVFDCINPLANPPKRN